MNAKQETQIKMMTVEQLEKKNTQLTTYFLNVKLYMCEGSKEAALTIMQKNGSKAEWQLVRKVLKEKQKHATVGDSRGVEQNLRRKTVRVRRSQNARQKRA